MGGLFSRKNSWLLILASFFVVFVLTFLQVPSWCEWVYPQWLVLVVLYWSFVAPQRVNTGVAWLVGVFLDILYNAPIGEYALILVLAVYLLNKFERKINLLSFGKKIVILFGFVVTWQLLPTLIQFFLGKQFYFWSALSQSVIGALVWLTALFLNDSKSRPQFENYY